ncbi:MAG TPA: LytTR family DNA-binding domain-containing protein [Burkholderiaceae bacterium]|jgi:two-component system LytT family response regulator
MKIKTLIAEDEILAAQALADWVNAHPQLELVAVCHDGASALAQIRALQVDLVLTDIQMPGLTGLQLVRALAEDEAKPAIIFTTAYDEHALAAFELHALDYLLKPFSQERFHEAIEHALTHRPAPAEVAQALEETGPDAGPLTRVLVRDQGKIFPLQAEHIEHLRADSKYTAITSRGRSYLVRLPITAFEQRLDPERFLRLQRGCIANLDFIESMTPDENSQLVVLMRDGTRITASREVSKKLREQSI